MGLHQSHGGASAEPVGRKRIEAADRFFTGFAYPHLRAGRYYLTRHQHDLSGDHGKPTVRHRVFRRERHDDDGDRHLSRARARLYRQHAEIVG